MKGRDLSLRKKPVEAIVYPIKSGLVKSFLTEAQLSFKQFYLTTAINYANGAPHIGHAYEGITSDIISRYHRMIEEMYFF